ncbi:MAG: hypothetical protein IJ092_02100 [Atopobiaceae bacterium]|nr:hypothetical protein [Atopobiaceae bacterium]MBR1830303.1 hypothetical protein [Atopobiaceae bacterium]
MAEDMRNIASTAGMDEFERGYEVPDCVVLDSAYCSMGRMIALRACKVAGWTYHDSTTLLELVPECGVTLEDVDAFERQFTGSEPDVAAVRRTEEYQRISTAYHLAAEKAIASGPCLIHDRVTKAFVEGLGYRCASAMTYAHDLPAMRVRAKVSPLYCDLSSDADLDAAIRREDSVRRAWHMLNSDTTLWGEPGTYDLMICTDLIGRDFAAQLLAQLMMGQA